MANHRAIAIGINQYQFFQPLSYAQADAQTLWNFLVEEAGWSADQCLLLTDSSPPVHDQSTYPSQDNLFSWIDKWSQEGVTAAEGSLWFFFSGYGVTVDGEDYLMPIEGKSGNIQETGIPIRFVFNCLKSSSCENILVLLDMNRSQGTQAGTSVGAQTIQLAKEMGIPTILSSQLNQFSHEASSLGHGLFTAGLLEGLRYDPGMTLESLNRYLHDRLLELSDHHAQPVQTPLIIIPSPEASHQLLMLPVQQSEASRQYIGAGINGSSFGASSYPSAVQAPVRDSTNYPPSSSQSTPTPSAGATSRQAALVLHPNSKSLGNESPWWFQLLFWLGGMALVLGMIGGVFLRNKSAFMGQQVINPPGETTSPGVVPVDPPVIQETPTAVTQPSSAPESASPPPQTQEPSPTPAASLQDKQQANQAVLNKAKSYILPAQASKFTQAIVETRKIKPGEPLYEQAQAEISNWSREILYVAQGRAQQGQFDTAIAAARLVPPDNQTIYKEAQQSINRWRGQAQLKRENQTLLQAAKGLIRPGQASSYNRAITAARKVQPGQPGYAEREQLVSQWSQQIYLIAQSRASRGQFQQAVQTATLVPKDTPSYNNAQKAIAKWKQGKK